MSGFRGSCAGAVGVRGGPTGRDSPYNQALNIKKAGRCSTLDAFDGRWAVGRGASCE